MESSDFAGRTAIVTGAASGIGREIARQLSAHGAYVMLTDVVQPGLEQAVAEINESGGRAEWSILDVTNAGEIQAVVDRVVAEHGSLDYMFNNAGVAIFGAMELMTIADWDKIIDVNLRGVAYGSSAAYKQMVKQRSGHIVNTASVAGLVPVPLQAQYCATKHAVVGLSKTMSVEAKDHGVTITAFCPAFVVSGMFFNNTMRGELEGADARKMVPFKPLSTETAVERLLEGVAKRKAFIITPFYGRLGWWIERLSPALNYRVHRVTLRETRRRAKKAR
jgi:NAD(P)-dependent dehydrogenase (short-subunit alcohol dehydrogenase family)